MQGTQVQSWNSYNPTKVLFGAGSRASLVNIVRGRKILAVGTARGRQQFESDPVVGNLDAEIHWVDNVRPNPGLTETQREIDRLAGSEFHAVLAFGGGSAIDAAKALTAALSPYARSRNLAELIARPQDLLPPWLLPIHAVPTTSGTGSEVTPFATIWDHENRKKLSLASPLLFPRTAIVDPELTYGLPREATLSTGLDALNQAFESVWNRNRIPMTVMMAGRAIRLALEALPRLSVDLDDQQARSQIAEASLLAGLCISQTRTAICHSISYPLTAHFDIAHGYACAYTMAAVAREVLAEQPSLLNDVARLVGKASGEALVAALAEVLERVNLRAGIADKIGDLKTVLALRPQMSTPGRSDNFILPVTDDLLARTLAASAQPYRFKPNDPAYRFLCMKADLEGSGDSAIPHLDQLLPEAAELVVGTNRERSTHLGLEPDAIALSGPGKFQKGKWWLSEVKRTAGGWFLVWNGTGLKNEVYSIFVDEFLLHLAKPSAGVIGRVLLKGPLKGGYRFTILSKSGILRHAYGDDFLPAYDLPTSTILKNELFSKSLKKGIKNGRFIDKKGGFYIPSLNSEEKKRNLKNLYSEVNSYLESKCGYSIYVTHGTLLGLVRSNDLIPNDDDFDCAYLSRFDNCPDVSKERFTIIDALKAGGFRCHLGVTGHLKIISPTASIDLMPAWFEKEYYNVSGFTSIKLSKGSIEPLSLVKMLGYPVFAPNSPADFLEGNYGPNWRTPDPFYKSKPNARAVQHRIQFVHDQNIFLGKSAELTPATTDY